MVAPHQATLNSSFSERDELVKARGPMRLILNAADAADRGITDGAVIDVWNDLAHVRFYADVRSNVAPGAVVAEGGVQRGTVPERPDRERPAERRPDRRRPRRHAVRQHGGRRAGVTKAAGFPALFTVY